jgi:hypothetical protein
LEGFPQAFKKCENTATMTPFKGTIFAQSNVFTMVQSSGTPKIPHRALVRRMRITTIINNINNNHRHNHNNNQRESGTRMALLMCEALQ